MERERWEDLAADQGGAIARRQLLAHGVTGSAIDRALRSGRLLATLSGVYVVRGAPETSIQRRWIALLAAGPDGVLAFESAARVHGLATVSADGPTIVIVHHSGFRRLTDVTAHQINDVRPDHVGRVDGMPVTTVPRTIVDLAAVWRLGRMALVIDSAVADRQTSIAAIGDCLRSVARRGKPGVRILTTLLDERGPGTVPAQSMLEGTFFGLVRRAGLPAPVRQYPLPRSDGAVGLVDAAWPDWRLIVEVDGRRWHQRLADMRRDRERDVMAAAQGWLVVRFLHEHIVGAPDETIRELQAVIDARIALLGGAA
ncbi:DUF559 domain-containing protein [Actinospongicola halichondriae]|uniref:DUF559 domain-containing protein n=1 Tax=Actinospongicola halichondriae TaxID=3236844 RepID=UPI003D3F2012